MYQRHALNLLRRIKTPQQRRFAGHDSHGHGHEHAAPVKESLGKSVWLLLAVPPIAYFLYQDAQPNSENEAPFLTRWLQKFDFTEENRARNNLHAKLVEQAAADRMLFMYSERHPVFRTVPVRNLEMINARDPFNRQAGWGSINLDKLIAHVEEANAEQYRKNLERYQRILEEEESSKKSK